MIFSLIIFLFVRLIKSDEFCSKSIGKSDEFSIYCQRANGSLNNRCCFVSSTTTEIIAIDLTNLDLKEIPQLNSSIRFIDLRWNFQIEQRKNFDFLHLKNLDELFLPENYFCPGGNRIWNSIENLTNSFHCRGQKDFCVNRTDICPTDRSFCNSNGPNHFLCLCRANFYGYKCLRTGEFPSLRFFAATTTITILLSTIFYWTHRRNLLK